MTGWRLEDDDEDDDVDAVALLAERKASMARLYSRVERNCVESRGLLHRQCGSQPSKSSSWENEKAYLFARMMSPSIRLPPLPDVFEGKKRKSRRRSWIA